MGVQKEGAVCVGKWGTAPSKIEDQFFETIAQSFLKSDL